MLSFTSISLNSTPHYIILRVNEWNDNPVSLWFSFVTAANTDTIMALFLLCVSMNTQYWSFEYWINQQEDICNPGDSYTVWNGFAINSEPKLHIIFLSLVSLFLPWRETRNQYEIINCSSYDKQSVSDVFSNFNDRSSNL